MSGGSRSVTWNKGPSRSTKRQYCAGSIAGAIDDSVLDFDELDLMVGEAATVAARLAEVQP